MTSLDDMDTLGEKLGEICLQSLPEAGDVCYFLLLISTDGAKTVVTTNIEPADAIEVMRRHIQLYESGRMSRARAISKGTTH